MVFRQVRGRLMEHAFKGPHLKTYDISFRKLVDMILAMDADERGLLIKEAERINAKMRGTRKPCHIPVQLAKADGVYAAVIRNLSFRGAFLVCKIPVLIGEEVLVKFKEDRDEAAPVLRSRIVHATGVGIGIRFERMDSRAARFIQKKMNG
jgi:hypothetical protein